MTDAKYRTIKALVLDYVHRMNGMVDYKELTKKVLEHFPKSRWQKSHWSWYSYQIRAGRFKNEFSDKERANIGHGQKGRISERPPTPVALKHKSETLAPSRGHRPKDPEVKRLGDGILEHVRFVIALAAGDDSNLRFKLNRWVFARLMHDEIRAKRPIKKKLWEGGIRSCQACGQAFASLKGIELHRKDSTIGYSVENCELLCRDCHQELGRR